MKHVVDTHALIWFLEGNSRLGANARTILSEADSQLILPVIALAEAVWIVERGKTNQGETVRVLTCDQNITASGLVPIVW